MSNLTLRVDGSLPGELVLDLSRAEGSPLRVAVKTQITGEEVKDDPALLNQLLPPNLLRELKQWILNDAGSGVLIVSSANSQMDVIPWEYLPQVLAAAKLFVVRHFVPLEPLVEERTLSVKRLLAAGWSGKPIFSLPGIQAELTALSQLGAVADFQVQVLFESNLVTLADACSTFRPEILHLIPAAIRHNHAMSGLILSDGEQIEEIPTDQFLSSLPASFRPHLVVLNTCSGGDAVGGPPALRTIAEQLSTMAVGWLGPVDDRSAVDFARFLYARILDGEPVINALRSYISIQPSKWNSEQATRHLRPLVGSRHYDAVPVIWTPSVALLTKSLRDQHDDGAALGPDAPSPVRSTTRGGQLMRREGEVDATQAFYPPLMTVEFSPQMWLNPALLKNGRPAINNLVLTSDRAVRNVGVAVSCDTGNGISTVRQTLNLEKGPQPVPIDTWQFPVLYELIGAAVPRRQINFTVSCTLAGELLAETTKPVLWMGGTEWLDKPDTWRFIPAFVDPYADGVLDAIGKSDEILKTIAGPKSSFDGYQSNDKLYVTNQVKAVFNCLRDKPYELRYIAPPPLLVYTPGDIFASGQRVRQPNEVITRQRGTCHDLTILFASCLEQIQVYPLIILITGHTFFGFWKDVVAYDRFWSQAGKDGVRRPNDPGREWTITDLKEIQQLLDLDAIVLVDAVAVTNRNANFEDAVAAGNEYFKQLSANKPNRKFDVAVDIQASRRAVQPL